MSLHKILQAPEVLHQPCHANLKRKQEFVKHFSYLEND